MVSVLSGPTEMMEIGTFHINENCVEFLREAQNYYVDEKGRFSDPDDCIDSARYALIGCLQGLAEPWDDRSPKARFAAAKHNMKAMRLNKQKDKPVWKRSWSADSGVQ